MTKKNRQIDDVEEIKDKTILVLSNFIKSYGLTPSESRLFSVLFLEEVPMTLDEMSQSLGMSKTSMSTGVHSLLNAEMIEQIWKKGVRKDLYQAENNLYKTFSNTFIEKWISEIRRNAKDFYKILGQIHSLLSEINQEEDPKRYDSLTLYIKKIEYIIEFNKWLEGIYKEIQRKIEK